MEGVESTKGNKIGVRLSFRVVQYLLCSPILSDHLVPAVANGSHLSVREYFLLPLNQKKVEHRSSWLSFSVVVEVDPQCGALCLSQHLTTEASLLSEIYEAGNRVGVEWLCKQGGHWDRAGFFLLCCNAAPPVQLYLALVTKPTAL